MNINKFNPVVFRAIIPSVKPSEEVKNVYKTTELLNDMLNSNIYIFENPKFYKLYDENPTEIKEKLKNLYNIEPWGETKGRLILSEFSKNVSEKHIPLLCDPGIVSRLDDFYAFAKEVKDIDKLTPLQLREKYSKKFGNVKVYRGLMLTSEEAKNVEKIGMRVQNMDNEEGNKLIENLLLPLKNKILPHSYREAIYRKANGEGGLNPLISVTQREKIAENVPRKYSNKSGTKDYIYEINMPKINLVEPTGEFKVQYPGGGFYDENYNPVPIQEIESFVPYMIKPEYIKLSKIVD